MKTLHATVAAKRIEATDVVSLELRPRPGEHLPAFTAGAHIDVHVDAGLVRQYSLCNHPADRDRYVIAVVRDPASRGGSVAIHDRVQAGDLLRISAPRNLFPLQRARRSLLFAGGIGVTPLLSMAEQLSAWHMDFELHYCTRTQARTSFRAQLAASRYAARVHHHFDDGDRAQLLDVDDVLGPPDGSTHVYVCGPTPFMEHVLGHAIASGWSRKNLHYEYFSAPPLDTSGDTPFDLRIASTGETLLVPVGRSAAEVLQEHGFEVEVSCRQGVCGSCITSVLEGVPDHRDRCLSEAEHGRNDEFTPCCSRAKSAALVLDL